MDYDSLLCRLFFKDTKFGKRLNGKIKTYNYKIQQNKLNNIQSYLVNRYNDWTDKHQYSVNETLYRILNNISTLPKCEICNNIVDFNCTSYRKYCSKKCKCSDKSHYHKMVETRKQNLNKRYGEDIDNVFQLEHVKNKIKDTHLIRTGYNNPLSNPEIRKQIKTEYKNATGYDNPTKNPIVKQKIIKTNIERYGTEHVLSNKDIREKSIKTCIERYGTEYYNQCSIGKERLSNTMKSDKHKQHEYNVKKKNKSFNISKKEDKIYNILSEYYNDVIRQYRSDEYPYNCDFYIKSLDLYIEFNGTWTHGGHRFDYNNIEDHNKLDVWKEKAKTSKYYRNAIYTWTILDVEKYNTAIKNKLNYIIFWNIQDCLDFINKK